MHALIAVIGPDKRWHPGIGDPSIMGWVTVAAYALAAIVCIRYARRANLGIGHALLWLGLGLVMAGLAVNKQLDLQSWFTQTLRDLSKEQGWYAQRRTYQTWFIRTLIIGGAVGVIALFAATWRQRWRNWPAIVGLGFLGCFVVIRAASFHHVDVLLKSDIAGVKVNWLLELGGIAVVAAAAMVNLVAARRRAGMPVVERHNQPAQRRAA